MIAAFAGALFTALCLLCAWMVAPLAERVWSRVVRVDLRRVAKLVRVTWRQMGSDQRQIVVFEASFVFMFLWWSVAIVGGR